MDTIERVKLKNSRYDIFINILCLIQLIGIVIYFLIIWNTFPDQIPGHYNAAGEITRWGNKAELLILPVISWFMYLMITGTEQFPEIWNTGVEVTEENRERVYQILKNMIGVLKLVMVTAFSFIAFNSSLAKALPVWFTPVFLFLCFGSIIFFVVKLIRAR
jgi:uncharacterized membrane protein